MASEHATPTLTIEADTVSAQIGGHHFIVDKALLLEKLPYFESNFADMMRDVETKIFNPEVLELLIKWIEGGYDAISIKLPESIEEVYDTTESHVDNLVELYIAAEILSCTELMDDTMTAIIPHCRSGLLFSQNSQQIKTAYSNTSLGSKLREFTAGGIAWRLLFAKKRSRAAAESKMVNDSRVESERRIVETLNEHRIKHKEFVAEWIEEHGGDEKILDLIEDFDKDEAKWAKKEARYAAERPFYRVAPIFTAEDCWALTTEVDGLGLDVFRWLYKFASDPISPFDQEVCYYHVSNAEDHRLTCTAWKNFPRIEDGSGAYPKVTFHREKSVESLPRLAEDVNREEAVEGKESVTEASKDRG